MENITPFMKVGIEFDWIALFFCRSDLILTVTLDMI